MAKDSGGRPAADRQGSVWSESAHLRPKQQSALRVLGSSDGESLRQVGLYADITSHLTP